MLWDSIVRYKTERGALGSKTGYPRLLPEQNPRTETGRVALPGQDHMYPFGIIGVAPRFIPAGAESELA